jgi:hypothetical protein
MITGAAILRTRIAGPQILPMNPTSQESSARQAILGNPIPIDFSKASPSLTQRSMPRFECMASAFPLA